MRPCAHSNTLTPTCQEDFRQPAQLLVDLNLGAICGQRLSARFASLARAQMGNLVDSPCSRAEAEGLAAYLSAVLARPHLTAVHLTEVLDGRLQREVCFELAQSA